MQDSFKIEKESSREIDFEDNDIVKQLYGELNGNLKEIENIFGVNIYSRGGKVSLRGDPKDVESVERFLNETYRIISKGYKLEPGDIEAAARIVIEDEIPLEEVFLDTVCISTRKRIIAPKSISQKIYIEAIRKHDLVLGIGPAGTGKTYLAMAMAVTAFINRQVNRIILTRPAVEAGEKLGFLPGDLNQKS